MRGRPVIYFHTQDAAVDYLTRMRKAKDDEVGETVTMRNFLEGMDGRIFGVAYWFHEEQNGFAWWIEFNIDGFVENEVEVLGVRESAESEVR